MAITNKTQFIFGGPVPGSGNWQAPDADGMLKESNETITSTGQTLDSGDKTQTAKAQAVVSARGNFYVGGGAINNYTADPIDSQLGIFDYQDGMEIRVAIPAGLTNTANSTIVVNGLVGVKGIFYNGVPVLAGMIPASTTIRLRYKSIGTLFELIQDIDNNAFYVDKINKRIGVGKTNPQDAIDVVGGGLFTGPVIASNSVKAAINFNPVTLAINSSFNISGVTAPTPNSFYQITFIDPLPAADYVVSASYPAASVQGPGQWNDYTVSPLPGTFLVGSLDFRTAAWNTSVNQFGGPTTDGTFVCLMIH